MPKKATPKKAAAKPSGATLPDWAGSAFKLSETDDVMESFYAPTASPSNPATAPLAEIALAEREARPEPRASEIPIAPVADWPVIMPEIVAAVMPFANTTVPDESVAAASQAAGAVTKQTPRRNLLGRSPRAAREIRRANNSNESVPSPYENFSLKEILPGKALDLYTALFAQTQAANASHNRLRLTKNSLRAIAGIANIKTANAHERYLIALGLIVRRSVAGDHDGSTYEIKALEDLGLSDDTIADFYAYLEGFATAGI